MNNQEKPLALAKAGLNELQREIERHAKGVGTVGDMSQLLEFQRHLEEIQRQLESNSVPGKSMRKSGMGHAIVDSWPLDSKLGDCCAPRNRHTGTFEQTGQATHREARLGQAPALGKLRHLDNPALKLPGLDRGFGQQAEYSGWLYSIESCRFGVFWSGVTEDERPDRKPSHGVRRFDFADRGGQHSSLVTRRSRADPRSVGSLPAGHLSATVRQAGGHPAEHGAVLGSAP